MEQWIATEFGYENHVGARGEKRFGLMIDTARAGPVLIEKHGLSVVVVIAVEEYERPTGCTKAEPKQSDRALAARRSGEASE